MMRLWIVALLAWNAPSGQASSPQQQEFLGAMQRGRELQASGLPHEAWRQFAEAVEIGQSIDPTSEVTALTWLASVSRQLGRIREAERAMVRCLAVLEQMRGQSTYDPAAHATTLAALGASDLGMGRR